MYFIFLQIVPDRNLTMALSYATPAINYWCYMLVVTTKGFLRLTVLVELVHALFPLSAFATIDWEAVKRIVPFMSA